MRARLLGGLLVAALGLACGGKPEEAIPPGEVAGSDKARLQTPAPKEDLDKVVKGQTELALELHRQLAADNDENLIFSPFSISVALSMSYAGAEGATQQAFETVLKGGLSEAAHHHAMNDLDRQLTSRGQGASGADGQPFRLNTANQIFAKKGYPIELPFLDTLALEYGANMRLMEFDRDPEGARESINRWVEQKTEDRIKDLLAPGTIENDTRLVLVNAVYFNASWLTPFEPNATRNEDFHLLSGGTKSVAFMNAPDLGTRAAQVDGVEVFELAYDGNELSMLVLMPAQGTFKAFENALTAETLAGYVAALKAEHLGLSFPKFEARTSANLRAPLDALGLGVAFSSTADFSGITKEEQLAITGVVHQAFVKVNEAGTEAAAATAVIFGPTSVPVVRPLKVDRPFIFAVRDNATGAVVFLGRVTVP